MTLDDLLASLRTMPATAPLIFETDEYEIGSGYHLTEFKLARITGIDCGGRVTSWTEAAVQLLDGRGGAHLSTGKVAGILAHGIDRVPGLGDAPVHVEFAPGNAGLRRFDVAAPGERDGRAILRLTEESATCKPLQTPRPPRGDESGETASAPCCR